MLEADDAQLLQLRGCDLAFAEEVKQCCKGVKRTGVVIHVLPKRLPHVGLKPCVAALQTDVLLGCQGDVQDVVCVCSLVDAPFHDVVRLLTVDASDVEKPH